MRIDSVTGEVFTHHLDQDGREILDPTPIAPPVGYKRQPSMAEQIRNMVRSEALRLAAEQAGAETFEEADDFDIGDDFDPSSPYENDFDPPIREVFQEVRAEGERKKKEKPPVEQGASPTEVDKARKEEATPPPKDPPAS